MVPCRTITAEELQAWQNIAFKLGGILKTVRKENTDEWMEYCRDELIKADMEVQRLIGIYGGLP